MKSLRLSSGITVNLMLARDTGDFINKTKKEKQLNKQRIQAWGVVVPFVAPATQEDEAGGSLIYVQSISLER